MTTSNELSMIGSTTAIQQNLNKIWTTLKQTITDNNNEHGIIANNFTNSVTEYINQHIDTVVDNTLQQHYQTKNNIYTYNMMAETDNICQVVVNNTDKYHVVYHDNTKNNWWILAVSPTKWYEFNGNDYNTQISQTDSTIRYFDTKALYYNYRKLCWLATDTKLIINNNEFTCYKSNVMDNLYLIPI